MPSPRDFTIYISDMRVAAGRIRDYIQDYTFAQFEADQKTIDAVLRNFEIIGEAAGRVPDQIQRSAPEIDWRRIKDFRNVLAHFYSGVDLETVWDMIEHRLPALQISLDILYGKLNAR